MTNVEGKCLWCWLQGCGLDRYGSVYWSASTCGSLSLQQWGSVQFVGGWNWTRAIRCDDRAPRPALRESNKLAPIQWNLWVERLPRMINLSPHIRVDECLVPFQGQCLFKQYMPGKLVKYGVKIWAACDIRTSYAKKKQVYTGKPQDGQQERNQGMCVVHDLATGLQGHTVTCDNFFTSYAHGQELIKKSWLWLAQFTKTNLNSHLLFWQQETELCFSLLHSLRLSLVSYCPKRHRNVLLMSTCHKDAKIGDWEDKKPEVILDYSVCKGGVDNIDKVFTNVMIWYSILLIFKVFDRVSVISFTRRYTNLCVWNIADDCKLQLQAQDKSLASGCLLYIPWCFGHKCLRGVERSQYIMAERVEYEKEALSRAAGERSGVASHGAMATPASCTSLCNNPKEITGFFWHSRPSTEPLQNLYIQIEKGARFVHGPMIRKLTSAQTAEEPFVMLT